MLLAATAASQPSGWQPLAADAAVGVVGGADVEARIGGILRRHVLSDHFVEGVHHGVAHFEGALADLAEREAFGHQLHLDRQRVGDHEGERLVVDRSWPCGG